MYPALENDVRGETARATGKALMWAQPEQNKGDGLCFFRRRQSAKFTPMHIFAPSNATLAPASKENIAACFSDAVCRDSQSGGNQCSL